MIIMKKYLVFLILLLIPIVVNAESVQVDTFEDFKTAVTNGGEIVLTDDITLTSNIFFKKETTLDLNGKTLATGAYTIVNQSNLEIVDNGTDGQITSTGNNDGNYIIQNGGSSLSTPILTINSGNFVGLTNKAYGINNYANIIMNNGNISFDSYSIVNRNKLTLNNGSIISASGTGVYNYVESDFIMNDGYVETKGNSVALNLYGSCTATIKGGTLKALEHEKGNAISAFKDTSLTVEGGTIISNGNAITGNGSNSGLSEGTNAKFTISGGTITSIRGAAVYAPQPNGETNITGGTFTGRNGVEVRAGVLNISGGTFTSKDTTYTVIPNDNGVTTFGSAVSVAQHVYGLPVEVNICGGTFNAPVPFVENNALGLAPEYVELVTVNIDSSCGKLVMNGTDPERTVYSENKTGFIRGGFYTLNVTEYVADGYVEIENEDMIEVVLPHNITLNSNGNGTTTVSTDRSPKLQEITITTTPEEDHRIESITVVDANNNIIPITDNKFIMPDSDVTINVTYVKKKEITVRFRVVNGLWNDGTTTDIVITLKEDDYGHIILPRDEIPSEMIAMDGFDEGFWDKTLNGEIELNEDTVFVYKFNEIINPETGDYKTGLYILLYLICSIGLYQTIKHRYIKTTSH